MSRLRWVGIAMVLVVALGGCIEADLASPECDGGKDTLVLMAQSVPSATLVPCIDTMPAGWMMVGNEIKKDRTSLRVGGENGRTDGGFVLDFTAECDTSGAVQVPSDEEAVQRFESVSDIADGYHGNRYYVFDGGCVSLRFDLTGEGWSAVVNDASAALTFAARSDLDAYVRRRSRGIIEGL